MVRPIYGQVVVGPPGSGKTTYCNGMQQYLRLLGRNAWVVNLDPANEGISSRKHGDSDRILPYEMIFDVCEEIVNITSVMKETGLGPNGGLMYCMEYLEAHVEEVVNLIRKRLESSSSNSSPEKNKIPKNRESSSTDYYLLLDLPGQVECYTHSTCVSKLLMQLTKTLDLRLTAVQLMDAFSCCTDAGKFLSAALLSTTTMLRLELPTINVLSKIDLLSSQQLDLALDYYLECQDLDRLVPFVDSKTNKFLSNSHDLEEEEDEDELNIAQDPDYQQVRLKRLAQEQRSFPNRLLGNYSSSNSSALAKLYRSLAEVVQDFGLLHFIPLDINDAVTVGRVVAKVDKCNGYVFRNNSTESIPYNIMFQCASQQSENEYEVLADIQERIWNKPAGQNNSSNNNL